MDGLEVNPTDVGRAFIIHAPPLTFQRPLHGLFGQFAGFDQGTSALGGLLPARLSADERPGPGVSHEEVCMDNLKAEGLPEPIVRGLEVIVEMARKLTGRKLPHHVASASNRGSQGHGLRKAHPQGN